MDSNLLIAITGVVGTIIGSYITALATRKKRGKIVILHLNAYSWFHPTKPSVDDTDLNIDVSFYNTGEFDQTVYSFKFYIKKKNSFKKLQIFPSVGYATKFIKISASDIQDFCFIYDEDPVIEFMKKTNDSFIDENKYKIIFTYKIVGSLFKKSKVCPYSCLRADWQNSLDLMAECYHEEKRASKTHK